VSKQSYWIADPNGGAKALVEGADERNRWTQVHGWAEADEPGPGDQVWVHNSKTDGRTVMAADAIGTEDGGSYWRGVGFRPSAPAEPVDLTKDPALRDQPKPVPPSKSAAATADSTTTKPAAADTSSKEK
jgi:hypothetical protein